MNEIEALRVVKMLMAAYEQSWKPSEDAIRLFKTILSVPELDAKIVEAVVLERVRSDEQFAPPVGVIYSKALSRSWEKFRRDFHRNASEIIESCHSTEHPGLLDDAKARAAMKAYRLVCEYQYEEISKAVDRYMRSHPERFPEERVPVAWRKAALDFPPLTDDMRDIARTIIPGITEDEIEQTFAGFRRWMLAEEKQLTPELLAKEFEVGLQQQLPANR
jgi:hypothetical protein